MSDTRLSRVRTWVGSRSAGTKIFSGAAVLAAIGAAATVINDFTEFSSAEHWIFHHSTVSIAILAGLLLVDDLRREFSHQGSTATHVRLRTIEEQRVKYIGFISASSGAESFYTLIFNHLVQASRALSDSGMRLLLIPWFPKQSFDIGKELRDDVRALQKVNNFQFSGLFIIPGDPDTDVDDLRLLREVSDNIVFLDVNFDPGDPPEGWNPCFVGGDEVRGGRLAAQVAVDYIQDAAIDEPRLLVLRGRTTGWESQRYRSFTEAVIAALPVASVTESDSELMYSREKARDYTYKSLCVGLRKGTVPHVIFACNDDMAIGAHDSVVRLLREGALDAASAPRIVGYDGIREMIDLLEAGDELILGTVDVSIEQLANHAMENMKHLIEGSAIVKRDPKMRIIRAYHAHGMGGLRP